MNAFTDHDIPTVSVVMPAYNAERTIGDAIRSVLQGKFQQFEIVVCDDGSTDRTTKIAARFKDDRIKILKNTINRGEGAARDRAIAESTGQWITFLDADDAFEPGRLAMLMELAADHPGCILFDEIMECHDGAEGIVKWRPVRRPQKTEARELEFSEWFAWTRTLVQPTFPACLVRNYDVRHTNKRFSADLEFLLRLIGKSGATIWYLPVPLYLYRLTSGGMSTVPDRYSLLVETLQDAIPLFSANQDAVRSLRNKVARVRRGSHYQDFFSHLTHMRLRQASREAWTRPWVVPEFIRRSIERVPYHVSRWKHKGKRRITT